MKITSLEFIPVSVPYTHREASSLVNRDGVTDVIVKAFTDDGLIGWGESCSGSNVESVLEALRGMAPFVIGRSPWRSDPGRTVASRYLVLAPAYRVLRLPRHRYSAVGRLREILRPAAL